MRKFIIGWSLAGIAGNVLALYLGDVCSGAEFGTVGAVRGISMGIAIMAPFAAILGTLPRRKSDKQSS